MSLLSQRVFTHPEYKKLALTASLQTKQKLIDEITDEILDNMDPQTICDHVNKTFNQSELVRKHADTAYSEYVPLELLHFMKRVPNGGRVLEPGCGPGRDALFMSFAHPGRLHFIKHKGGQKMLKKNYGIVQKEFKVIGIDNSSEMIEVAKEMHSRAVTAAGVRIKYPIYFIKDWRTLGPKFLTEPLDGIWSWMALATFTPHELLDREIELMASLLKRGGTLFIHYTNGAVAGGYDKLVISPRDNIQYTSQPSPFMIIESAEAHGLKLEKSRYSAHENLKGEKVRNMSVYQTFTKV